MSDTFLMKRTSIYREIERERLSQDEKWGGPEHDDTKGVRDWVTYIVVYLGRAVDRNSEWGRNLTISRIALVKIAALCVAALESFDRKMMAVGISDDPAASRYNAMD